jgi:hypothetical protein
MSKSSIICQIRQQKADGVSHFRRDGRRFYRSSHTRKNIKAFAVGMVRGPAGELRLNMLGDRRLPKRVKHVILGDADDFRFTPENGLNSDIAPCPKSAMNRHPFATYLHLIFEGKNKRPPRGDRS